MRKIRLGKTATSRTRNKKITDHTPIHAKDEFMYYLLSKGYSERSAKSYYRDAKQFTSWLKKEMIKPDDVQYNDITAYLQGLGTLAQHSKGCYLRGVKYYFNFLIACGRRTDNPVEFIRLRGMKRKTLYDILNRQQLDSLYQRYSLPDENSSDKNQNWFKSKLLAQQRNKVILGLIVFQSLDTTDLKLLSVRDVQLKEGKIFIPGTRRSNERELKLESLQIMELVEYLFKTRNELLQLTGKHTERLFVSTGSGQELHNLMQGLIKHLHVTNPKVISIRQLRASVIVHWLKLYNLREVQYMAGHRYVSSTESFLANEMEEMTGEIEKYHPIG